MIRLAMPDDVGQLVELGQRMHAESNYRVVPFDPKQTELFIRWLLGSPDGFIAVAEHDDELIGYAGGLASPMWFGRMDRKACTDYGLYVVPDYRRGATAVLLATAYRDWGVSHGCLQIRAGTAAGEAGQGANAIYEHLGFKRAGYLFVLDPPGGEHHAYQTFDHHLAVQ